MNTLDSLTIMGDLTATSIRTNSLSSSFISSTDLFSSSATTSTATFSNSITIGQTCYSATQLEALFNHLLTIYPELSL